MSRVTFRGVTLDSRTREMMQQVEKHWGRATVPTQGSYSTKVGASASTHAGGGAIDLSVSGLSSTQRNELILTMRYVGFAAWYRPTRAGVWSAHVHAIAIQDGGKADRGILAPSAHRQVIEYYDGYDGLAGDGRDPHASLRAPKQTFERFKARPMLPAFPGRLKLLEGARGEAVRVVEHALFLSTNGVMSAADLAAVKAYRLKHPTLWPARPYVGDRVWAALVRRLIVRLNYR
jgi:hypothetical protein